MGLEFEELFKPDLNKENEIKDFLEPIENKLMVEIFFDTCII